jgi:uncharacterized protein
LDGSDPHGGPDAGRYAPRRRTYTRLTQDTYRYESNTGFLAEIVVDDLGLVIAYPGGWERIASL